MKRLAELFLALWCAAACAAQFPPELVFQSTGDFQIGGYPFYLLRFDPHWAPKSQAQTDVSKKKTSFSAGGVSLEGTFDQFLLNETVTPVAEDTLQYAARLQSKGGSPVPSKVVCFVTQIPVADKPVILVDKKPLKLQTEKLRVSYVNGPQKLVEIQTKLRTFRISGSKMHVNVTGPFPPNEYSSTNYYSVRFSEEATYPQDTANKCSLITTWKLDLKLQFDVPRLRVNSSTPIPLEGAFNASLVDGGKLPAWTRQGKERDLRKLKPGTYDFQGVKMNVADAKEGTAPSCIVLGNSSRSSEANHNYGTAATVEATSPKGTRYLYLLHASAWNPGLDNLQGTISVQYKDGSKEEIPVIDMVDCYNWWKPLGGVNAPTVWEATTNDNIPFGLSLSAFPVKPDVTRLTFTPAPATVWMIVAASFTDSRTTFERKQNTYTVLEGPEWLALPKDYRPSTAKGSPLDFSTFREMPAGKYGRIIVNREGHFVFEKAPQKRIRLYGPNLVQGANFLPDDQIELFLQEAERIGYNTVRLHHYDQDILDHNAPDSLTFDPKKQDQFFKLIARLKERGFYICIDLYSSRTLKFGDNIPEFDNTGDYSMKNLVLISKAAMENWKTFSRKVLTVKNPYTKMTLAEDPVLYALNLVNENTVAVQWKHGRTSTKASKIIEERFQKSLKAKGLDLKPGSPEYNVRLGHFLVALQNACIQEQIRFLREDLKLGALITDVNHQNLTNMIPTRMLLDLVDNHKYHDHPSYPGKRWKLPAVFQNKSAIAFEPENQVPLKLAPTRIFGKPLTVTEFNFCYPNQWRVEAAPLVGGYAALQDWDGLYRFAWCHGYRKMNPKKFEKFSTFDAVNNIQAQMVDRLAELLFVRGDVSPAEKSTGVAFLYSQKQDFERGLLPGRTNYPNDFQQLGLWGLIGSTIADYKGDPGILRVDPFQPGWEDKLPEAARKAMANYRSTGKIASSTGELFLDTKGKTMTLLTPRTEAVTGKGKGKGNLIVSIDMNTYQTVAFASLDGKPLAESRRILAFQFSNILCKGLKYTITKLGQMYIEDWGELPMLLERAQANVQLKLPAAMTVTPLALDGTPAAKPYPAQYKDGILSFHLRTDSLPEGSLSAILTR